MGPFDFFIVTADETRKRIEPDKSLALTARGLDQRGQEFVLEEVFILPPL